MILSHEIKRSRETRTGLREIRDKKSKVENGLRRNLLFRSLYSSSEKRESGNETRFSFQYWSLCRIDRKNWSQDQISLMPFDPVPFFAPSFLLPSCFSQFTHSLLSSSRFFASSFLFTFSGGKQMSSLHSLTPSTQNQWWRRRSPDIKAGLSKRLHVISCWTWSVMQPQLDGEKHCCSEYNSTSSSVDAHQWENNGIAFQHRLSPCVWQPVNPPTFTLYQKEWWEKWNEWKTWSCRIGLLSVCLSCCNSRA